jgi:predicted Fe-S protein YdhL (DUF1289 family)
MTRKEIEQWRKLSERGRADLLKMIEPVSKRKEVAEKSGQSFSYLSDFYKDRKYMSDVRIFKIMDKVVE